VINSVKMLVFLCTLLVGISSSVDVEQALQSPRALLAQFQCYSSEFGKDYGTGVELRHRLTIFRSNLQFISSQNKAGLPFISGANKFTDLSDQELTLYTGLNHSIVDESADDGVPVLQLSDVPESIDWVSQGYVTPAKNQGKCGSCWAFGSVVSLEGAYKKTTGVLKDFAEQEYLDCVIIGREKNGCWGGAPHKCFEHTKKTGHMASQATYPYTATDDSKEECDLTQYKNSLIAAKVTSRFHTRKDQTEENLISVLAQGPLTVNIESTRALTAYKEGVMMDRTCWGQTNHAVAAVGYTAKYIIVKNSWGAEWGESGFVKFMRGYRNCGLYNVKQYPIFTLTGDAETEDGVSQADYDHTAIVGPDPPRPDPDCDNGFGDKFCENIPLTNCHSPTYKERFCRKKCGNCWID